MKRLTSFVSLLLFVALAMPGISEAKSTKSKSGPAAIYKDVDFGGMNMGQVLWKLNGKKVTLTLRSGENMTGILSMKEGRSAGLPKLIHLKKLERMDYFDAVVRPEEIVSVRFRAKKTR